MIPLEFLRRHKPGEAVAEKLVYSPDLPFQFHPHLSKTSPEVWLDYFSLFMWLFSWGFCLWIIFMW